MRKRSVVETTDSLAGSPQTGSGRPAAARVKDLTKVYGSGQAEVRALDGVTLDFHQGEFTAVMGPSGSGKSTLMHCCAALDAASSGSIVIGETDLSGLKDKELTQLRRDHVGFVFQQFNLLPVLTAEENVTLPLAIAGRRADPAAVDALLDRVGLTGRRHHKPAELSGGQQQRVAVARALVTRPTVLLADEPTGNLDTQASADVLALLREAVAVDGQTVVVVTHDDDVAAQADRVVTIVDGRIVRDTAR